MASLLHGQYLRNPSDVDLPGPKTELRLVTNFCITFPIFSCLTFVSMVFEWLILEQLFLVFYMINFLVQQIPIIDDGEWSDRDEAEGEEDELEEEEEEEDVPATKKNKLEAGKAEEAQGPKEAATPPPAIKQ